MDLGLVSPGLWLAVLAAMSLGGLLKVYDRAGFAAVRRARTGCDNFGGGGRGLDGLSQRGQISAWS